MANLPAWARSFFGKAGFLVEHTALVGVFLVCIKGIDLLSHALWQTGDKPLMFFHRRDTLIVWKRERQDEGE
jgi:hypothetical protein